MVQRSSAPTSLRPTIVRRHFSQRPQLYEPSGISQQTRRTSIATSDSATRASFCVRLGLVAVADELHGLGAPQAQQEWIRSEWLPLLVGHAAREEHLPQTRRQQVRNEGAGCSVERIPVDEWVGEGAEVRLDLDQGLAVGRTSPAHSIETA